MRPSPRGYALLALGLAAAIGLLGQRLLQDGRPPRPAPGGEGRSLYLDHCAVCHGPTGKGDGPGAAVLRQSITDFSDPAAMRGVDDRFLFEIIKKGGSQFGRSNAMPSWGMKLSDDEIRSLVAQIRSLASATPGASGGRREKVP